MLEKLKRRITNKKVIMAIVSAVLVILVNLGLVPVDAVSEYEATVNMILGILVTIGILSNPESHKEKENK